MAGPCHPRRGKSACGAADRGAADPRGAAVCRMPGSGALQCWLWYGTLWTAGTPWTTMTPWAARMPWTVRALWPAGGSAGLRAAGSCAMYTRVHSFPLHLAIPCNHSAVSRMVSSCDLPLPAPRLRHHGEPPRL